MEQFDAAGTNVIDKQHRRLYQRAQQALSLE
jgi:hypothetical protein